jgi:hypothetical protein
MPIITITGRSLLLALAALALIIVATLSTGTARAATIHACVKPGSGATRIVGAKAKCRHGEQKLSWSSSGPAGPKGAAGANGAAGAPGPEGKAGPTGSSALYTALEFESKTLTAGETTVLTETLPPGSFAVSAKTTIVAEAAKQAFTEGFCELADRPGTTGVGEVEVLDVSAWGGGLGQKGTNEFEADSMLVLQGPLTSEVTSTLFMACFNLETPVAEAAITQMQALTVSSIA